MSIRLQILSYWPWVPFRLDLPHEGRATGTAGLSWLFEKLGARISISAGSGCDPPSNRSGARIPTGTESRVWFPYRYKCIEIRTEARVSIHRSVAEPSATQVALDTMWDDGSWQSLGSRSSTRTAAEMREALAALMMGLLTVYTGRDGPDSSIAGSRGKRPVGAHADDRGRAPGPLPRGAS